MPTPTAKEVVVTKVRHGVSAFGALASKITGFSERTQWREETDKKLLDQALKIDAEMREDPDIVPPDPDKSKYVKNGHTAALEANGRYKL